VEANATGQLGRLLRQETGITPDHFVVRYDGLPFTPESILRDLAPEV
jgi:2-oxoglutarate/2-oxoacid ferredoxin oxidoreductase subunit alpha